VFVPETWTRTEQETDNQLQVVALAGLVVFFAAGLAALITGILGFVRHRVDMRALFAVFAATFVIAILSAANAWPAIAFGLSTTEPIATQWTLKVLRALASGLVVALLLALCAGVGVFGATRAPARARIGRLPTPLAAVAAGAFVLGLQSALGALAIPDAPTWPSERFASFASPLAGGVLSGAAFVGLASAELFVLYAVSRLTQGFARRLWLAVAIVLALELAVALAQGRAHLPAALIGGLIAGLVASAVLLMLLRYDPRMVPAFAATVVVLTGAVSAAQSREWAPFALDALATIAVAAIFTAYLRRAPSA